MKLQIIFKNLEPLVLDFGADLDKRLPKFEDSLVHEMNNDKNSMIFRLGAQNYVINLKEILYTRQISDTVVPVFKINKTESTVVDRFG